MSDPIYTVKGFVQDFQDFEKYRGDYVTIQTWLQWLKRHYAGVVTPGIYIRTRTYKKTTVEETKKDITRAIGEPYVEKLCLYLSLEDNRSGHANAIIVDLKHKEIWNFEPHGNTHVRSSFVPQRAAAVAIVREELAKHYPGVSFTEFGIESMPFLGPQRRECNNNSCTIRIDKEKLKRETEGYCAAWTMMYIHYHIINPGLPSFQVNNLINRRFSERELYHRVRGYAAT